MTDLIWALAIICVIAAVWFWSLPNPVDPLADYLPYDDLPPVAAFEDLPDDLDEYIADGILEIDEYINPEG